MSPDFVMLMIMLNTNTSQAFEVYNRGQTHFRVGDDTNLFDWSYVENVAYAHPLAADKLVESGPERDPLELLSLSVEESDMFDRYLPPIRLSTGQHRIPSSEARPSGPVLQQSPESIHVSQNFYDPSFQHQPRPIVRTKFDVLSKAALFLAEASPLRVAGQVFFITNGEPVRFRDFTIYVRNELDKIVDPEGKESDRKTKNRVSTICRLRFRVAYGVWGLAAGKAPHVYALQGCIQLQCEVA